MAHLLPAGTAAFHLSDGTQNQTITRADLYGVLRDEAVRRGVPIEYGKRLVHATTTPGGVVAQFADGKAVGRIGRLLLPLVFRFALPSAEKQAWLYGHRIDWERPVSAGATTVAG